MYKTIKHVLMYLSAHRNQPALAVLDISDALRASVTLAVTDHWPHKWDGRQKDPNLHRFAVGVADQIRKTKWREAFGLRWATVVGRDTTLSDEDAELMDRMEPIIELRPIDPKTVAGAK